MSSSSSPSSSSSLSSPSSPSLRSEIEFEEPTKATTRGQSAVMYEGDDVVGGGIIM